MKLKDIIIEFKGIEAEESPNREINEQLWVDYVENWFNSELVFCADREFVVEDLRKGEGYVYNLFDKWFSELERSNDWECNLSCWEYSLEDAFRDLYEDKFGIEQINKQVYWGCNIN